MRTIVTSEECGLWSEGGGLESGLVGIGFIGWRIMIVRRVCWRGGRGLRN